MHLATLSSRRLIGTAGLACAPVLASVAVLAVTASPAAPAGAAAARTPRCATSGLVVWLNNEQGGGTAGSVYYKLELTNLSGRACTLFGYPGVSAINLRGHRLGSGASHEASQQPRVVTVANGADATSVLRIIDAGALPDCRQVAAAGLRVYPPGQTTSKVVPFPFRACSRVGQGNLAVRAVVPEE
jgi:Protein of unknown function (DUF4232)